MKIVKILIMAFTVPALWSVAQAQEEDTSGRGKITFAATLGYNNYESAVAPDGGLASSYGVAQHATSWLSKGMMAGFEVGYFFSDAWRLVGSGGLNYAAYPGYYAVPGVPATGDVPGIPAYETIPIQHHLTYAIGLGGDRYFKSEDSGLAWFAGARAGLAYSQNSKRYNYADKVEFGSAVGRTFNYRFAAVAGADYYFSESFFIGAQIEALSYTYAVNSIKPQPGLANRSADHFNLSFLAAPTIKIGFVF